MSLPAGTDELSIRRALQAGMAHHDAGRLDQAEAAYREVLDASPDRPEALVLLADIAQRMGRSEEAFERIAHAVRVNPSMASYRNQLGMVLESCGRLDEAERAYRAALSLRADYEHAYLNLGNVLLARGRVDEAIAAYRRAIAARPDYAAARNNLGRALEEQGRLDDAIAAYREAMAIEEAPETRANLARCAARGARLPADPSFARLLARALAEAWIRPADLARAAIALIRADRELQPAIDAAAGAWPARLSADRLLPSSTLAALARHELLLALLANAQVCDAGLERFLTAARHARLEAAQRPATQDEALAFDCALARQCFLNDYVFSFTDEEAARLDTVRRELEAAIGAGQDVSPQRLAIVAAYVPLGELACVPQLVDRAWPDPLRAVVVQQVEEPRIEVGHHERIASLTPIRDAVSREVRRQYEESPYPRWVAVPRGAPLALDAQLRALFPQLAPGRVAKPDEILVAGCGTGQEAVEIARQFPASRILAVDLSRASLAFAMRKTGELALPNLEYAHADILEMAGIGRTFDFISCMGVLHHLRDPVAGWRALVALLRPGACMQVGLYSERARRDIVAARAQIAARGHAPDANGIRRCREELLAMPRFAPVTALRDFYGLHECRDLLFHVEEHRYTPPQLGEMAASLGLEVLGLAVEPATRRRCAKRCGREPDLAAWDDFEREFPGTFAGMYLLWVRKPGGS